ncbi:MAG: hypothetical protein ACR2NN_13385 [Bryobacteraceae bacterium]
MLRRTRLIVSIVVASTGFSTGAQESLGTSARLGPETLVSVNQDGGRLRCEPSVAATGDTIVVTWNDSYGGRHGSPAGVTIAWALSKDRGKTYSFGGYLPQASQSSVPSGADSTVIADRNGNFLLLLLSWQKDQQSLFLYEMKAGRVDRWIPRSRFSNVEAKLSLIDRPFMYIDARDRVWITFTTMMEGEQQVALLRSGNHGQSWDGPMIVSRGSGSKLPSRVMADGQSVTVVWEQSSKVSTELWRSVSRDGGETFPQAMRLTSGKPLATISGYVMGFSQEARAAYIPGFEIGGSSLLSDVAIVMDSPTGKGYEVKQGILPSGPLAKVFPDSRASFFPSAAETPQYSAVLAYCRRSESSLTDVCLSVQTKDSKRAMFQLNSTSTDWSNTPGDPDAAPVQRNFGDYISLAATEKYLVAVWTDGRSGAPRIFSRIIQLQE